MMTKKNIFVCLIALISVLTGCKKDGSSSVFIVKMRLSELTLNPTEIFKLEYSTEPEQVPVTSSVWSSSDASIVSVSQDGLVRAEAVGTAVVKVNVNGQASDSCTVSVMAPVQEIVFVSDKFTINPGKTTKLAYFVIPSDATVFMEEWISDDIDVATVSSDGTVTALRVGITHIILKVNDTVSDTCTVSVLTPVKQIALSSDDITLYPGKVTKLSYSVLPSDATVFREKWRSDNVDAVTVSSDGTVTALKVGTAHIVLKVNDAVSDTCSVTVNSADERGTGEDGDAEWKEL